MNGNILLRFVSFALYAEAPIRNSWLYRSHKTESSSLPRSSATCSNRLINDDYARGPTTNSHSAHKHTLLTLNLIILYDRVTHCLCGGFTLDSTTAVQFCGLTSSIAVYNCQSISGNRHPGRCRREHRRSEHRTAGSSVNSICYTPEQQQQHRRTTKQQPIMLDGTDRTDGGQMQNKTKPIVIVIILEILCVRLGN